MVKAKMKGLSHVVLSTVAKTQSCLAAIVYECIPIGDDDAAGINGLLAGPGSNDTMYRRELNGVSRMLA